MTSAGTPGQRGRWWRSRAVDSATYAAGGRQAGRVVPHAELPRIDGGDGPAVAVLDPVGAADRPRRRSLRRVRITSPIAAWLPSVSATSCSGEAPPRR